MKLIIGNKNYSSWSLRPWVLLKYFGIPFEEVLIPLYEGDYKARILKYSPQGKVPVLIHGAVAVWESLAIAHYVADLFPEKNMWPREPSARGLAYAISQEMHAGFVQLRAHMPMNLRGSYPGEGRTPDVEKDMARVTEIWTACRKQFKDDGPFLFGPFTVADAMFAPVVTRFRTYGVSLNGAALDYMKTMSALPAFKEWEEAGIKEPWVIKASEIYNPQYKA
jgi:glutathione S-transferase